MNVSTTKTTQKTTKKITQKTKKKQLTRFDKEALNAHKKIISERTGIVVFTEFDLRTRKKERQEIAKKGQNITVFINRAGSLCHIVTREGTITILESETHLRGYDEAYIFNEFYNNKIVPMLRTFGQAFSISARKKLQRARKDSF